MEESQELAILLLGDAGVGKSTFLSRLSLGANSAASLPHLRDLDQPFPFDVKLYNRPYRLEFYDTASPTNYTLLKPAVIILCFSIADPASLVSLHTSWKTTVETHFNHDESLPVIVLGLQRDVRSKEDYDGRVPATAPSSASSSSSSSGPNARGLGSRPLVYPQEGVRVAQEMRCDRYCECSARTGDLCRQVFEDIARTAAMTTTAKGGKTEGGCDIM